MHKKIRHSVFETNSSSSHSLTIAEPNVLDMLEDGVLFINRIPKIILESSNSSNSSITTATTQLEKLAFVIACLKTEPEYLDKGVADELVLKLIAFYNINKIESDKYYSIWDEYYTIISKSFEELIELINNDLVLTYVYEEY